LAKNKFQKPYRKLSGAEMHYSSYCRLATITFIILLSGCNKIAPLSSDLTDDTLNDRYVPISDGKIFLDGFITGGGFSQRQADAATSSMQSCSQLITQVYQTFNTFRFDISRRANDICQNPTNENPFQSPGFLYVYRPIFEYHVDPDDVAVERLGPNIEGAEAPSHNLSSAFSSFNQVCFQNIADLKNELGSAMVAGTCGDPEIHVRMVYSNSHQFDVPNLKISSQIKIILRKGVQPNRPEPITLESSSILKLHDVAQAIVSSGMDSSEVVLSTFAGSVTKVDLSTGRKIWEKNLTNPSLTSVQETTALNTLAVSRDSKWIAVGGDYGYLALLNGDTGHKARLLACDSTMFAPLHFQALNFSSDQRILISAAVQSTYPPSGTSYNKFLFGDRIEKKQISIVSWDLQSSSVIWTNQIEAGDILQVGFSKSQDFVLVAAKDRIVVFSALDGSLVREYELSHYEGKLTGSFVSGASFSDDLRLLAISSFSGVAIIDTESAKLIQRLRAPLKFELGRPEFMSATNQVRAYDASGNIFQWDLATSTLTEIGVAEGFRTNYNGPATMPILSLAGGRFLVHTQTDFSNGSSIPVPRGQTVSAYQMLCEAGDDADLPPLQIREAASLTIWSVR